VSTVNSQDQVTQKPLRDSVKQALKNYFAQLNGQDVNDLYELVHAISLGLPPNTPVKKQIDEFIRRWDNFPVAPERRANPGWAEN
ncbi:hypothetical protein MJM04_32650, partial [Salmonella enterica subsp. enterica serovar Cerro]|nr:hypothetical protein [Salmonella enterica subsp. enterica serovar Cerro]